MRFPSLFRFPKHQQFYIHPRYYDPVKEDIKNRTDSIKIRMDREKSGDSLPSGINFKRKTRSSSAVSIMRLGIAALLGVIVLGWIHFGGAIFYRLSGFILLFIFLVYLIYRLKILKRKR